MDHRLRNHSSSPSFSVLDLHWPSPPVPRPEPCGAIALPPAVTRPSVLPSKSQRVFKYITAIFAILHPAASPAFPLLDDNTSIDPPQDQWGPISDDPRDHGGPVLAHHDRPCFRDGS